MVLIVSEIGMNHDGHWDRAYELIRQSALAGADIAKFQFGWRHREGEINHIPPALARRLKEWCEHCGIEFMASIISPDALDLAKEVSPSRYKIASRTVVDHPQLVEDVLAQDRETFVSLGWWKGQGHGQGQAQGEGDWPFGPPTERLRYIYCQSSYPTYPADLRGLPERFHADGYYGFSDHSMGIEASLLAIARGAAFIEKHFTLDKTIRSVHNDHILSVTPQELRSLCEIGRPLSRLVSVVDGHEPGVGSVPEGVVSAAAGKPNG
jgi:sialic acid synthase SpsE